MSQTTLVQTQQSVSAPAKRPIDSLKSMLKAPSVQEQFNNALGEHRDLFISSLIDLFTGDNQLQTCDPKLVISEALRAATMKLPINKALGFAYIVVYNNSKKIKDEHGVDRWIKVPTPTFIPGYKGYIQLAMRTGQYKTINADVVYKGELRKVNKLSGEIDFNGQKESDEVVGYFCYFQLLNGFSKTLYVSVDEMAKYAKKFSPSVKKETTVENLIKLANTDVTKKSVGWEGNFNDMAIKTVIRRLLSKYGYLSVEMENAISGEVEADAAADRNTILIEDANAKEIDPNEVSFENVDKETGEIKAVENKAQEAAPEY